MTQESPEPVWDRQIPALQRRGVPELKGLKRKVRDKYWEILKRPDFSERLGLAVDALVDFDVSIAIEIERRRKGEGNV